ncbi:NlpC/P60 family protein [Gallaecimonas mangrovi]|uniref:NlpC/P60 family protein n=1 Tax=Gallaecimonas mangrovi TaxID=2291597 RepID=UPI000E1FEB8A|nr:NlpC/P60 family protein [Gallaecimonas mangrovi]
MKKALLLFLCLGLSACASKAPPPAPAANPQAANTVVEKLHQQYRHWRGVKYRLGGTSKSGVDCSAFTQITFMQQFATPLKRTTSEQVHQGHWVSQAKLKPGDLVFFKIRGYRHVGIYQGGGFFLHASTSLGVTVSSIKDPYWQAHYWTARRILQ